jgi:hypothetical protein
VLKMAKNVKLPRSHSGEFVKRLATAGVVWSVVKLLDTPRGKLMTKKIDKKITKASSDSGKTLKKRGAALRRNRGLLIAGVTALAVAAGLLGRASTK